LAYVYYRTEKEAEKVHKFVNLRYINNCQLLVSYSSNYFDITDFRTRIELEIFLDDPRYELKLFKIQRDRLLEELNKKESLSEEEKLKVEYFNRRCRSLEFALGFDEKKKALPVIDVESNRKLL
jgi:hypothetical protein